MFLISAQLDWKILAKLAGKKDATSNKESVTGVVRMVGAVEKEQIGVEVDVMELVGDLTTINVFP